MKNIIRSLINLIVILAGIAMLACTIFVESLSQDGATGIGTVGFIFVVLGWMFNSDNDHF